MQPLGRKPKFFNYVDNHLHNNGRKVANWHDDICWENKGGFRLGKYNIIKDGIEEYDFNQYWYNCIEDWYDEPFDISCDLLHRYNDGEFLESNILTHYDYDYEFEDW